MKKHLLTFITLFFVVPAVWANDITVTITESQTIAAIQTELQN
jgi:hypothetical protein